MLTREKIVDLLKTNDYAIIRALLALTDRQVSDERAQQVTKYRNGMGFRPCHARMGTAMAEFYTKRSYLTEKQISYWRKPDKNGKMRIEIYAGQLLEIAEQKANKS